MMFEAEKNTALPVEFIRSHPLLALERAGLTFEDLVLAINRGDCNADIADMQARADAKKDVNDV